MTTARTLILAGLMAPLIGAAAELSIETRRAFEDYVARAEAAMERRVAGNANQLWLDDHPEHAAAVRGGEVVIGYIGNNSMKNVPGGLIHDWVGAAFIPGVTLDETIGFVQDYDSHQNYYGPEVMESRLLSHDGDRFHIYYRLLKKKVITVVLNTEHEVEYRRVDDNRVHSRSYTTKVSEVKRVGQANETELPPGTGGGYLWNLNSYWRFVERDGGVYVETRAISLTRGIPTGTGWLVKPIVREMPRRSITDTLNNTRDGLAERRAAVASPAEAHKAID